MKILDSLTLEDWLSCSTLSRFQSCTLNDVVRDTTSRRSDKDDAGVPSAVVIDSDKRPFG